jgi:hypothetical protein
MNTFDNMIIETAILDIASGQSAYKSRIAKLILDEMSKKIYKKEATDCILFAIYKATMRNARYNQLEEDKCQEVGLEYKPELYDIGFYSFIQGIMDKVCWAARRGTNNRISVDEMEKEMLGGNGIDFANDLGDEIGIDASTKETIRQDVLEANRRLSNVSARLSQKLRIGADPLFLFAPTTLVNDEWVQPVKTDDWDIALAEMERISEELRANDKISNSDINEPIDFAA